MEKIVDEEMGYRYIYISGGSNSKYILALFHGMGGSEYDLIPIARAIDPELGILSLRGKVVENGLRRFFRRIRNGVYDVDDLKFRANEIADLIDILSRKHGFSGRKIVALGYSNGANMVIAIILLRPGVFSGAILMRPLFPLDIGYKDLGKIPILILAGERDTIAPIEKSIDLAKRLKRKKALVKLEILNAGHEIIEEDIHIVRNWLNMLLKNSIINTNTNIDIDGLSNII